MNNRWLLTALSLAIFAGPAAAAEAGAKVKVLVVTGGHGFDQPSQFEWKEKPIKVPAGRVHGLQVEIDPSARAWTAGVYEEGARGWLNDLKDNEAARKAFRGGEWNALRIECRGDWIRTWLNDVPAADLKDGRVRSGFIALQVHGVGKNEKPLEVRFRGLRLKEL
jgi:hypothetical protein